MSIIDIGWGMHVVSDPRHPLPGDVERVADWLVREAGFDTAPASLADVLATVEPLRGGARRVQVAVPHAGVPPGSSLDEQVLRNGEAIRTSVRSWPLVPVAPDLALVTEFTVRPDGTVHDETIHCGAAAGEEAGSDLIAFANQANLHYLSDRGYAWLGRDAAPTDWERLREYAIRYGIFPETPELLEKACGPGPLAVNGARVSATAPQLHASDLVMQRLLEAAMAGLPAPYGMTELQALADHFNRRERLAREVEMRVEASAGAARAAEHVGERCRGEVEMVTPLGATVHLPDLRASGFLPHRLVRLGEQVTVAIQDVDFEKGFVQVALCA